MSWTTNINWGWYLLGIIAGFAGGYFIKGKVASEKDGKNQPRSRVKFCPHCGESLEATK